MGAHRRALQLGRHLGFETQAADGGADEHARSVEVLAHPSLDALLIRVEESNAGPFIPLLDEVIDESWLATPVQLAGYGVRDDGSIASELEFLVELVVELGADTIVVDGEGRTGACSGDSSGPLLTRDRTGTLVVAGVLSQGTASCVHVARYVRADRIYEWVLAQTQSATVPESDCAGVTSRGFCNRGLATWCDGQTIRIDACDEGRVCGWRSPVGYRCVSLEQDACAGVSEVGACADTASRSCVDGELVERDCSACGLTCAWDATLGRFGCLE
jgi:hypothetical protein